MPPSTRLLLSWALLPALATSCAGPAGDADARRARAAQDLAWVTAPDRPSHPPPTLTASPSAEANLRRCGTTEEGFEGWMDAFRRHAVEQGISPQTVAIALDGLTYDPEVIELDRSQSSFALPFAEFSAQRVTPRRVAKARALLRVHAEILAKIEARFGVPPEILVAIWGLETDFGANLGSRSCLRSLSTLAHDCRRQERFRGELLSALRIIDRGDLAPREMRGAWAGELGQTQFLPSSYERFAVDFDGDGRADLIGSSVDVLASTANYLKEHGFRPHEDYRPGSANDAALGTWNRSEVYRKTIALFATKLTRKR